MSGAASGRLWALPEPEDGLVLGARLFHRQALREESVIHADLEMEVLVVAFLPQRFRGPGVPYEGEGLPLGDPRAHLHLVRDVREVGVAGRDSVTVVDPDLAAAQLVQGTRDRK